MATEKTIFTRIINKNDSLANWTTNNPVLKQGEIALAYIETTTAGGEIIPTYLMKVGHGNAKFNDLKWVAAPASDVYAWAKSAKLSDVAEFSTLSSTVGTNKSDISTLKSDVAGIKQLTGTTTVAAQITAAIEALDVTDTAKTGEFVTAVSEADGKITVTRAALKASDIPTITSSKISDFTAAVQALIDAERAEIDTAISGAKSEITTAYTNADTALQEALTAEIDKKYTKPSSGIAKTDLASGVQTSLGRADTAVQPGDLIVYAKTADVESDIATAKTQAQNTVIGTSSDASTADTVYGAKKYAEEKASAAQTAATGAASTDATNKANKALTDAKAYTDTRETAITTAYEAYADKAEADANTYTDTKLEAYSTKTVADGLYDAKGAANTAETNAKKYADDLKASILGEGLTETFDTLKEIEDWINGAGVNATELATAIADEAGLREAADAGLSDRITELEKIDHDHSNKTVLDGITAAKVTAWDNASAGNHSHSNKAELDKIASGDVAKWNAAEQNAKDYAEEKATDAKNAAISAAAADAKAKIEALDVTVTGMGAGKTIATLTEVDGKIAATFQNISITKSQVSDFGSYDASGSAAKALTDAKAYTDQEVGKVNTTLGSYSTTAQMNTAISNAIAGLDVTAVNVGASETVKAVSETNGKISVTKQSIAITKSQVTDFKDSDYDAAGTAQTKADEALNSAKNYTNTEIGKVNTKISGLTMDDIGSGTSDVVWVFDCGTSSTVM